MGDYIGENRLDDVLWLCSLTESELDLLISLKEMIIQRAKTMGQEGLTQKFDLKMLRAIAFIMMENLKSQFKSSPVPDILKSSAVTDTCRLLNSFTSDDIKFEDLEQFIGPNFWKRLHEGASPKRKKRKSTT